MLQFLKKSNRKKDDLNNRLSSPVQIDDFEKISEAENFIFERKESLQQSQTKLSRNLSDILADKNCLSYFVQYLETRNALPFIKFWLDIESFRASVEVCCRRLSVPTLSSLRGNSYTRRFLNKSISTDGCSELSYSSCDLDNISLASQGEGGIAEIRNIASSIDGIQTTSSECSTIPEISSVTPELLQSKLSKGNGVQSIVADNCDIGTWRSLTDDEKSQIREQNKKSSLDVEKSFQTPISLDAIRIYRKYFITSSQYYVDIPATLLSRISLALCPSTITKSDGDGAGSDGAEPTETENQLTHCFDVAQKYVFDRLESGYLTSYLESVFYCKFTVDILTKEKITLNDILYNELGLFYFMEFLEQDNNRNYLDFWIAAINFEKQIAENLYSYNHSQAQTDAMILYERYFSLQATNSLRMSNKVRFGIEENICKEGTEFPVAGCFDIPIHVTEFYLHTKYFDKFVKSPLFYKLLSELLTKIKQNDLLGSIQSQTNGGLVCQQTTTTIQTNSIKNKKQHRKTFSDCTSDNTKNFRQNTLLAMESSSTISSRRNRNSEKQLCGGSSNTATTDMHIDSRLLHNPDLLWQRNSINGSGNSKLCFGRIDSLGRYERDFEEFDATCDEKWSLTLGRTRTKLRNAVKKLVNLPEDKVQEELAWQIAEMIVKDITSVTLNNQEESNAVTKMPVT